MAGSLNPHTCKCQKRGSGVVRLRLMYVLQDLFCGVRATNQSAHDNGADAA